MIRRYLSVLLIVVFVATVFSPIVTADAMEYRETTNQINLKPGVSDLNSNVINLMNGSDIQQEKDIIYSQLPQGTEGKYYGSYLPASQIQFPRTGGYFQFATNYTISNSIIANGVSAFWLRVPIVPSQYQYWHLFCSWDSIYVEYFAMPGNSAVLQAFYPEEVAKLSLPWYIGSYYYQTLYPQTSGWNANYPGNYWSINENQTASNIIETEKGLFIYLQGIFKPNVQFTLSFTGRLYDRENPNVFVTSETETPNETQSFRFFDPFLYINPDHIAIDDFGFSPDNKKTLPLKPAWDFVFMSGIGKEGMLSYILDFHNEGLDRKAGLWYPTLWNGVDNEKVQQLFFRQTIDKTTLSSPTSLVYFTFYMPFSIIKTNKTDMENKISWDILVTVFGGVGNTAYFNNSGVYYSEVEMTVTSTENFLFFSAPYPLTTHGSPKLPYDWSEVNVVLRLAPVENCTLKLLANEPGTNLRSLTNAVMNNYLSSFRSDIRVGGLMLPLFNDMHLSNGLFVSVTPSKLFSIYDFGWGKAYEIRGFQSLYIFLDGGGRFFLTASQEEILDGLDAKRSGKNSSGFDPFKALWDLIKGAVQGLAGFVYDGLMWVWDTIVGIADWIYNAVSGIWGWIISVVTDIINKVSNILEGLLYGFPIMSLLFIVNYAGGYLSTGTVKQMTKQLSKKGLKKKLVRLRRKYRRVLKPITKTYAKKTRALDKRIRIQRAEQKRMDAQQRTQSQRSYRIQRDSPERGEYRGLSHKQAIERDDPRRRRRRI